MNVTSVNTARKEGDDQDDAVQLQRQNRQRELLMKRKLDNAYKASEIVRELKRESGHVAIEERNIQRQASLQRGYISKQQQQQHDDDGGSDYSFYNNFTTSKVHRDMKRRQRQQERSSRRQNSKITTTESLLIGLV